MLFFRRNAEAENLERLAELAKSEKTGFGRKEIDRILENGGHAYLIELGTSWSEPESNKLIGFAVFAEGEERPLLLCIAKEYQDERFPQVCFSDNSYYGGVGEDNQSSVKDCWEQYKQRLHDDDKWPEPEQESFRLDAAALQAAIRKLYNITAMGWSLKKFDGNGLVEVSPDKIPSEVFSAEYGLDDYFFQSITGFSSPPARSKAFQDALAGKEVGNVEDKGELKQVTIPARCAEDILEYSGLGLSHLFPMHQPGSELGDHSGGRFGGRSGLNK